MTNDLKYYGNDRLREIVLQEFTQWFEGLFDEEFKGAVWSSSYVIDNNNKISACAGITTKLYGVFDITCEAEYKGPYEFINPDALSIICDDLLYSLWCKVTQNRGRDVFKSGEPFGSG